MGQVVGQIMERSKMCGVCKKRPSTRLCDFVVDYNNFMFDVPMSQQSKYETCSFPLCDECAKKFGNSDFCPYHAKLLRKIQLPEDMQLIANAVKYDDLFK
ncbi:hypothetical protein [Furfurilactobacillus rossiae]|uniref:hypothetical protein n=1 Tax=Furfurilactobacillus rossiae TaxID=231049 RepID=UPI0015B82C11|nr:hypothetical protein [Furfurilactobacillus rossiae]